MDNLNELSKRANINLKRTYYSDVVIYEDHRTILNVLYFLKQKGDVNFPINLFMFDAHDDGVHTNDDQKKIIKGFIESDPTLEEFWMFTEFKLRSLDDDWVKAGMELGLINNCFLFNLTKSNIRMECVEKYQTESFGIKKTYNMGNVWDALSIRGCLEDKIKEDEFSELWEDIGWIWNQKSRRFEFVPTHDFILDIDLDCFSTEILDKTMAIPFELLHEKFTKFLNPDKHDFSTAKIFFERLMKDSKLVTLCFENGCCGGFNEAFKIFNNVDEILFDGELGNPSI